MATKSITIKRHEFMKALTNVCNATDLPAFVMLEVLERLTGQVEKLAESELQRDTKNYQQELQKEQMEREAALKKAEAEDKKEDPSNHPEGEPHEENRS